MIVLYCSIGANLHCLIQSYYAALVETVFKNHINHRANIVSAAYNGYVRSIQFVSSMTLVVDQVLL